MAEQALIRISGNYTIPCSTDSTDMLLNFCTNDIPFTNNGLFKVQTEGESKKGLTASLFIYT